MRTTVTEINRDLILHCAESQKCFSNVQIKIMKFRKPPKTDLLLMRDEASLILSFWWKIPHAKLQKFCCFWGCVLTRDPVLAKTMQEPVLGANGL